VWGDAVNVASRMESTGAEGRIQVPQDVYERLKLKFVFEERGELVGEGQGCAAHLVPGRRGYVRGVAIYLHLMRAAVLRQAVIRPEVFAFSTSLTRLTAVLSHRSAEVALERANAKVTDRYGGTSIGRSIAALLAPPHGNALRGAVVIIASDGWDSDPPDVLTHALDRMRRRAELLVWLNPSRGAHRVPATGRFHGGGPALLRSVPAGALADRPARAPAGAGLSTFDHPHRVVAAVSDVDGVAARIYCQPRRSHAPNSTRRISRGFSAIVA